MPRSEPFPMKLYNVIKNSEYIEWSYEGDSFCIRDNDLFEQYVLPTSFNNSCMLSFSRQLLSYGFIRITDCRTSKDEPNNNFCAFYHPKFKRDFPEDVLSIKKVDKSKLKKREPKFVHMNPIKSAREKKMKYNNPE